MVISRRRDRDPGRARAAQRARAALRGPCATRGPRSVRVSLPGIRRAVESYLDALRRSGGLRELLTRCSQLDAAPGFGGWSPTRCAAAARYTIAAADDPCLASNRAMSPERNARAMAAERELYERVEEVIGDGVLLHPPFPRVAPRHGATIGRPWVLAPMRGLQPDSGCRSPRCRWASTSRACRLASRSPRPPRPRPRRDRRRSGARARLRRLDQAWHLRGQTPPVPSSPQASLIVIVAD